MTPHLLLAAARIHAAVRAAPAVCGPYPTKTLGHSLFGAINRPLAAVLAWFYSLVPNYAFAILCVSVAWAIIIAPLTLKSTRSMLAMQRLQPQMKKLQAEHKNDRQALNQAMMDLYKQENVSPLGGCLPMLLPFPVFIALFEVIDGLSRTHLVHGVRCAYPQFLSPTTAMFHAIWRANGRIDAFGLDLAKNALSAHPSFLAALPYFVLLLVMIGTQYLQSAQMYARNPSMQDNPQAKFMKYLPVVFGIIFIRFPAGVILYYAASSICRILQQSLMYRFDPSVRRLAVRDIREVEQEIDDIEAGRTKRVANPRTDRQAGSPPARSSGGPGSRLREALARQQEAATPPTRAATAKAKGKPASTGAARSDGRPGEPKPANPTQTRRSGTKAPPSGKAAPTPQQGRTPPGSDRAPAPDGDRSRSGGRASVDASAPAERKGDRSSAATPPGTPRSGSRTGATSGRPSAPRSGDRQRRGR